MSGLGVVDPMNPSVKPTDDDGNEIQHKTIGFDEEATRAAGDKVASLISEGEDLAASGTGSDLIVGSQKIYEARNQYSAILNNNQLIGSMLEKAADALVKN